MNGAATEGMSPKRGLALLDRLVAEGKIPSTKYDDVVVHSQRTACTINEAIIQLGLYSESDLLKYAATLYRTRFVGTERLSKAGIAASLLKMVPRKMAKKLIAFPILFDVKSRVLSVVAADVSSEDVRQELIFATGARDVKVYVAREASIRALIAKHYDGDKKAFDRLAQLARSIEERMSEPDPVWATSGVVFEEEEGELVQTGSGVEVYEVEEPPTDKFSTPPTPPPPTPPPPVQATPSPPSAVAAPEAVQPKAHREVMKVLVTMLEQSTLDRRGHSAHVARLCEQLAQRMRLTEAQQHAIQIAAYIHDVGVASHVTPLALAIDPSRRDEVRRTYMAPSRMFESASLPVEALRALVHRYERFDGTGFPERLSGKDIPFGARILAVAESYVELTRSNANPAGGRLTPEDACEALDQHKGTTLDPTSVDWLRRIVLADELKGKLISKQYRALLVESDPEETAVLEVRFTEQGYEVFIERTLQDAIRLLDAEAFDIVVSEVDLPDGDGFELLQHLRERAQSKTPLIFLTGRKDQSSANRGLDLGAADYLMKPASAGVVAAKAQRIIEEGRSAAAGSRGVAGSLTEMALPDVIQILANGRKSGRLKVRSGTAIGELVFQEGSIHDAGFGQLSGEEAVYAILALTEGDFALDPKSQPMQNQIGMSTEGLLLEAMRRIDEAQR